MSIGFFLSLVMQLFGVTYKIKALNEIINQTDWGSLDYLLIDLPPGQRHTS